jgi:hypothetical protein
VDTLPDVPADPLAPLLDLPTVAESVATSRAAVDGLLRHRMLRRRSNEVSAESALRGAWANAVLSGAPVQLSAMRAGDVADPVVQGALRVSAELGQVAETWSVAPRQVLARLHLLAAADLDAAPERLGRPSGGQGVADRIDLLSRTLAATRAPAVVVGAVVAGELMALDAFAPVTTIVANAALRLTLVERGLDPKSLVVVEVGALELRGEQPAVLAGYAAGTGAGLAGWIAHVAEVVRLGARESVAMCEAMQRG